MAVMELQNKMLELMFELDDYLRKHNIEYMAFAGTQLGADRHDGLIPWDDDIDILMTLDNYDRFIKASQKELPEGRKVNALELSPEYILTYGRYVDVTTTAIQRHTAFGGVDPGIKLDVFFAVPTHADRDKAYQHQMEILAFSELVMPTAIMKYRRPEEFFPVYEKEKEAFDKLGRTKYIEKRLPELKYKYVSRFRKPKRYVLFSGMMRNSYLFDAKPMETVKTISFEGGRIMVASEGEYFNELLYGESWYQIPEDFEIPRHNWAANLNQSYHMTLENIRSKIDLHEAEQNMITKKQMKLDEQVQFKDAIVFREELRNLASGMDVDYLYGKLKEQETILPKEAFAVFKAYYTQQMSKENLWYRLAVPLEPDTLSAALECLASYGDYAKVHSFLSILDTNGQLQKLDPDHLEHIRSQAELSKKLIRALYIDKDDTGVNSILSGRQDLKEDTITNITVAEARGRMLLHEIRKTGDAKIREELAGKLIALAENAESQYGPIGEILILKGYGRKVQEEIKCSCEEGASWQDIMFEAAARCSNGYVIQELINMGIDFYAARKAPNAHGVKKRKVYYLEEQAYERTREMLRKLFGNSKDKAFAVAGKGEDERVVVKDLKRLATSPVTMAKQNSKNIYYRAIWRKKTGQQDSISRTTIYIYGEHVDPKEYYRRAEDAGILTEQKRSNYLDYLAWNKAHLQPANRKANEYMAQLKQVVEESF